MPIHNPSIAAVTLTPTEICQLDAIAARLETDRRHVLAIAIDDYYQRAPRLPEGEIVFADGDVEQPDPTPAEKGSDQ